MPDPPRLLDPLPEGSPLAGLPRIIPGPMEGVTEGPFLKAMTALGWAPCWFTPFLRISTGVPRRARLREWLEPYLAGGLPVIAQVLGSHPGRLAETAGRLRELGASCVDLNCACPSRTVVGNGGGAARLADPAWITETLLAMRERCGGGPVSVKLRTGLAAPEEFPRIAAAVQAAAPDLVTLHFRTAAEAYDPVPDGLERLRRARELLPGRLLYGSGDLFTPEDILRMRETALVDGAAPARGLLRNPALIRDTVLLLETGRRRETGAAEKLAFLRQVAEASPADSGNGFLLQIAGGLFGCGSALFRRLVGLPTARRIQAFLSETPGTELENLCL